MGLMQRKPFRRGEDVEIKYAETLVTGCSTYIRNLGLSQT